MKVRRRNASLVMQRRYRDHHALLRHEENAVAAQAIQRRVRGIQARGFVRHVLHSAREEGHRAARAARSAAYAAAVAVADMDPTGGWDRGSCGVVAQGGGHVFVRLRRKQHRATIKLQSVVRMYQVALEWSQVLRVARSRRAGGAYDAAVKSQRTEDMNHHTKGRRRHRRLSNARLLKKSAKVAADNAAASAAAPRDKRRPRRASRERRSSGPLALAPLATRVQALNLPDAHRVK